MGLLKTNNSYTRGNMSKKLFVPIMLCCVISLCAGCALGVKHDLATVKPHLSGKGSGDVALAVHDQRPFILNGNKKPDFIGLQRGGYGNPWDVHTKSGRPLSEDMVSAISNGLADAGLNTKAISASYSESPASVRDRIVAIGDNRALLVTITQWKTDTYVNVKLLYDLRAEVLDAKGIVLAHNEVRGEENLGGNFINPPAHAIRASPEAFGHKLEALVGSPTILDALMGGTDRITPAKTTAAVGKNAQPQN